MNTRTILDRNCVQIVAIFFTVGGDQGLLNQYFKGWNRLSCLYNAQATTVYTYAPAYEK